MIYLASPYTHDIETVRQLRFWQVTKVTADLHEQGIQAFSPITFGYGVEQIGKISLSGPDWWQPFDDWFLRHCDEMYVICLDGWRESVGVNHEIDLAIDLDIPIKYFRFNLDFTITEMKGSEIDER